jgi:VWFA-related protein
MQLKTKGFWSFALVILAVGLSAQISSSAAPVQQPATGGQPSAQRPTFKVEVDLVTTDVIVRDERGNFVPDLTKTDFEILEDGVKQNIVSMTLSHGGRVTNVLAPPPPPAPEGVILPTARPVEDTSGRIFLFFVDDLHFPFKETIRVRDLFRRISKLLVHEGDMFGIVSSGPSSLAVQMTYDKRRLDEAITKMTGSELKPGEIINGPSGSEGPAEVRYRAHVAMSTVMDILNNLEKVHNRRKALVYVSDGYDFAPFQASRLGTMGADSPFLQNRQASQSGSTGSGTSADAGAQQTKEEFADADLAMQLAELTRTANRANTTIYTIDPRGLAAGPDIDEPVDPTQWLDFLRKSQSTLRTLADETGGLAVINQNDFDKALKRIDAETSDYYVLGYYSTNPDATRRLRKVDVRVARNGVEVYARKEYLLKGPTPPPVAKKP